MTKSDKSKRVRVTDKITEKSIATWNPEQPIIITAGTGVGKSYFVKNVLYKYAKADNQKILMLIHRKLCVEQFRMEIEEDDKSDVIEIMTYQKLEKNEMYEIDLELSQYKYIVCDEFHYFISDASFNNTTDISFKKIIGMSNTIKIFMSATGENVSNRRLSQVISADYLRRKYLPHSAVNDADAHYIGWHRRLSRAYFSSAMTGLK